MKLIELHMNHGAIEEATARSVVNVYEFAKRHAWISPLELALYRHYCVPGNKVELYTPATTSTTSGFTWESWTHDDGSRKDFYDNPPNPTWYAYGVRAWVPE